MGSDTVRCVFCGWELQVKGGRLPRHLVDGRVCLGSRQVIRPEAYGHIRRRIPFCGTPCVACGQPVQLMTIHDGVHAAWPCGDAFPTQPARSRDITAVPESAPHRLDADDPPPERVRFPAIAPVRRRTPIGA
ncbi:MAG TPA: hypothetical protein VHW44_23545 [Pseudonocardiaceae bacterium]|jgi:hypothetical protein|nr:hypothetical protein [Pseudonocardiaceae bacterium]